MSNNNSWGQTNHLQVVGLTTITNADCTSRLAVAGEDRRVIDTKICTFTRVSLSLLLQINFNSNRIF